MSIKFTTLPAKSLYQPILSTDVTFKLADITGFSGNNLTSSDFGTVGYGVLLNSDRSVMELFSWDPTTIASVSISFVLRGLPFDGGPASVTANKLDWPAGSTVLLGSDTPQFIQWIKDYIDGIAIAGAPDASTTIKGIVEEATQAEVDAGTAAGGTAARLFINPSTHRGRAYNDYAADSVGTDSYAITPTPAITAYAVGQIFIFKAGTLNTGACTLNVSGLGAKTIKKNVTDDLATGDILANQDVLVQYDGTNMQILSLISGLKDATKMTGILPIANGGTGKSANSQIYKSGVVAFTNSNGTQNIAHGLGAVPLHIKILYFGTSGQPGPSFSVGTYDGVSTAMATIYPSTSNTISASSTSNILEGHNASSSCSSTVTMDATNIILATSIVNGGIPGYIIWEAWGI